MNDYRYQLERYRGRGSRYVSSQCGRKYRFTLYIDTHNNNEYVNERVGKCNRLDKCDYHYTPRQYFEDNPWRRDNSCSHVQTHRVFEHVNVNKPQFLLVLSLSHKMERTDLCYPQQKRQPHKMRRDTSCGVLITIITHLLTLRAII